MYPHLAKALAKAQLHLGTRRRVERLPAAALQHVVDNRRHTAISACLIIGVVLK
jgi:hypothetical protein